MERISQSHAESQAEVQEKDRRILECENKVRCKIHVSLFGTTCTSVLLEFIEGLS